MGVLKHRTQLFAPWLVFAALFVGFGSSLFQTAAGTPASAATDQDSSISAHLGGPSSVGVQLDANEDARELPGAAWPRVPKLRDRLEQEYGLVLGAGFQALFQHASDSPAEDKAAGGVVRFYGKWIPFNRGDPGAGRLVFKVENRHQLGADIAPQDLGPTIGYAGLTAVTFSDVGSILTNLYWAQAFADNRFAFVVGIVDVTDYVDVYGLVNPWTEFNNLAFTTDPTIPAPNQGPGAAARWLFTPSHYVLGGVSDASGEPGNPVKGFQNLFSDGEYFRYIEFGWIGSWENRYSDNIHVSAWQVDDREEVQVDGGWGVAFSFFRKVLERWLPFLRGGYSDGGGSPVERSVSAGVGY